MIRLHNFPFSCGMDKAREDFADRYLRQNSPGVCYVAISSEGFVVGWVAGQALDYAFSDEKIFSISAWDVDPDWLGWGIGWTLMTKLMSFAKSKGLRWFTVGVNPDASPYPERAYQALQKHGFKEFERSFLIDLNANMGSVSAPSPQK